MLSLRPYAMMSATFLNPAPLCALILCATIPNAAEDAVKLNCKR